MWHGMRLEEWTVLLATSFIIVLGFFMVICA